MVAHGSAALVLLRFFLPAALLLATCLVFTFPSLLFFVAFLVLHFRPRYEVTKLNFPVIYLLVLTVYSALLVIAHIVLAALVPRDGFDVSPQLAHALAIPNYKATPWLACKLLLAPVVVLIFSCLVLNSSTPDGEERYFKIGKPRKEKNSTDEDSDETPTSQSPLEDVKGRSSASLAYEDRPVDRVVITKFTKHMAGRGGIFWTTIACGFTGLSYSSLLTVIFLAAFAFVVVVWAFRITRLHPLRLQNACVLAVRSFRIFVMLYLVFIVALQNKWFVAFQTREGSVRRAFRLIGFVELDTAVPEGWAYVTGFCAAVATYVFSGIFVYSLMDLITARSQENALDKEEMGTAESEQVGYKLSYYETQFLNAVLHLSSLGLLTWSLVFPGLLTLPMMIAALAYFASKRVRHARFIDRIIVYAIVLQIAHFLFVAITTAFPMMSKSEYFKGFIQRFITLLGLRSFKPQFTMNLVQALALGLFCTNIFCKRYIRAAMRQGSRTGNRNAPLGFRDFFRSAEFSATAKKQRAMYLTLKLILDQLALASLYISAGTKASWLNCFFILALCVLCLCQAFGVCRRQKIMLYIWTVVLAYSTVFLLITCTVCRAIDDFTRKCDLKLVGIFPAESLEVVAYTSTLVFSAIQVHFTWSAAQTGSEDETALLEDYRSLFWQITRKYFLFVAYVALLVYPLVYPANFLSYGYVLFLAISILVELLGPSLRRDNPSVRPLIRAYWPTVVLFTACAMLARYLARFHLGESFARNWVFGFCRDGLELCKPGNNLSDVEQMLRNLNEFKFTVGDASILIIVSLQGRLFGIDGLLNNSRTDRSHGDSDIVRHRVTSSTVDVEGLPSSSATLNRLSTGIGLPNPRSEQGTDFNRGSLSVGETLPPQESDMESHRQSLLTSRGGHMRNVSGRSDIFGTEITRTYQDRPSNVLRTIQTDRLSEMREDSSVRRVAIADKERLNQFAQKIRNWRMSLPVKQTEKFLHSAYEYTLAIVRAMLLRYSYVLEACAILAAAVWLPGFSVFGAVYIITGCVLLLSEQAFVDVGGTWQSQRMSQASVLSSSTNRMTKILPIVLAILSFALMSGQYVFSVIDAIHKIGPNYIFKYIGFQMWGKTPIQQQTPIEQQAMLAHVLVFVTAFVQRVAVKWAAKDAMKICEEQKQALEFGSILPNPMQSQEELGGAVRIADVLSGVGGFSLPPPQIPFDMEDHLNRRGAQEKNAVSTTPRQPEPPEFSPLQSLGLQQVAGLHPELSTQATAVSDMSPPTRPSDFEGIDLQSNTSSESGDDGYAELKGSSVNGILVRIIEGAKRWIKKAYNLGWEVASLLAPFWQKWGFDLTFMYLVIGGAFTKTSFSVIYIALVMGVSGFRRKRIERHWHHITLLLASLVLLQYFLTLGIPRPPPATESTSTIQERWLIWLYLDAGNPSPDRKWDVTFAFLAVICASMTLNAVSPGRRGISYWFKKSLLPPSEAPSRPESASQKTPLDDMVLLKEQNGKTNTPSDDFAQKPRDGPSDFRFFGGTPETFSTGNPTESRIPEDGAITTSVRADVAEGAVGETQDDTNLAQMLFIRNSGDDDFTQRPISMKNMIKLGWMRFAGSIVQLYMFAAAVVVTNIFSGILLLLSFYFMFQFTNVNLKKSKFIIVRFYVLSIVFILVVYQAPIPCLGSWAEVLGLFKTKYNAQGDVLCKTKDNAQGDVLLYLMVSVWLICQMQGRIYESSSFKYVVKFGEEDAKVRFKRAVHEHNTRKYEHMLGRNKNYRARKAREGRLDRLKKLKSTTDRSVDALYKVCVEDEMAYLRRNAEATKGKGHIFSSHVKTEEEELEKKTDEGKLRIFFRFMLRGRSWRKYTSHPLVSEFRVFISRYSGLSVYFAMLLAAVVNPSQLTALYPLALFLYLILEQPRPPKQVWQFLMCYVCIIITGKYIVKRTSSCSHNFFLPQAGGQAGGLCDLGAGIFFDILVFLALLWHRTVLYYRGLWDLRSSEEDMLLSNEIHGKRVKTDSELEMTELPPVDEDESVLLSAHTSSFWSKDESPRRTSASVISADQQCSDVAEVLKRARESIVSFVREAEQRESFPTALSAPKTIVSLKKPALPALDISAVKRSKTFAFHSGPHTAPLSNSGTPRSTIGAFRQDAASGDLSRFGSLRLTGRLRALEQMEEEKNMTASQSLVQKSLVEWKVIPPGHLSLFHSSGNSGFFGGIMSHFAKLTKEHEHKAVGDYYILIFLVDFISFVFVTFGFSSIFNSGTDSKPWWTVNFIEIRHLLTLMGLFCALVMDRVVYLTRSMRGKLLLQYMSVIIYHVVIFYLQDNIRTSFTTKAFYMLRCVYFLLSGLQIRNGFPTYTTAQFLLRNYNTPGIILFEIYNFIPFLWLMRTLLDWAVVPTTLEIFQYFRFVDIYIWLYRNRAVNTARGCFQRRLGQRRRWLPRVYQGCGIFLLCAIALFVPFLFFSVLNPFTINRDPNQATLSVDLLVHTSNFNATAEAYSIFSRTTFIGGILQRKDRARVQDILGFTVSQKDGKSNYLADFGTISDEEWNLPASAETKLLQSLERTKPEPSLLYQLSAKSKNQEFKIETRVPLSAQNVSAISGSIKNRTDIALKLTTTLPVYAILDAGSTTFRTNGTIAERAVCVRHIHTALIDGGGSFWSLQSCRSSNCACTNNPSGSSTERNLFVLEFAVVSGLEVGGSTILTLYGVILFTLANFMRGFFADKRLIIPYIDMPYTLHLYQLVLDIIYARQDNELEMEEILYNGLTDIYRDQHVLAKWSGERALKVPRAWWEGSENEEAYYCYPSFCETEHEPYMTRIVE